MTINEKKTQSMWFVSHRMRKDLPDLTLEINNKTLDEVKHYPYLGVDLDMDLNLEKYVNNTANKMSNKVFKLGKLRTSINEHAAICVYKQGVLPMADYCCFLAESARRDPAQRLQVIQNQGLRICLKVRTRNETVQGLHERTEVPFLADRRKEMLTAMMYRKSKKIRPVIKARNTRSDGKFVFPTRIAKSKMCMKSPYNRGVQLWNTLDAKVQTAKTKEIFKVAVKRHFGTVTKGKRKEYYARLRQPP